ncbi:MAG TPA: hypothetical protein VI451_08715, partial [Anaerolineales bacterium]|nr:hypothetical protein [Anaerolineales bacterium]
GKKPRAPKPNWQTPRSRIRPIRMLGPRDYLQHAREYPIMGCWVIDGWEEQGITPVIVARQQAPDKVIFAVCLMDIYCLGVKDAYANADFSLAKFQHELPTMCNGAPKECTVELAHEIIYGGLEYAARYDFQPHRDFTAQMCDKVLDPPEVHPRSHDVTFGKDGKPFYVSGPYDDERKINSVIKTLTRTAGEGNFHYLVGFGPPDFFDE